MEIIKFNEIKNRKKNIISLVIFRMLDEYRDFEKYLYHFDLLIKNLINNTYDFDIRVYFDDSSHKDIESYIKEFKNIEFYKFNFKPLKLGKFHNGTFGALIRLLPIFENEYEYIYIDDIDIPVEWINWEAVDFIFKNNIDTYLYSIAHHIKPWFNINNKYNIEYPLITKIKLSINIFNKFINDLAGNKYNELVTKLINYKPYEFYYNYKVKCPYGIDKYFINNIIYDDLCKKITYTKINYDPSRIFRFLYEHKYNLFTKRDIEIIEYLISIDKISYKTHESEIKRYTKILYLKFLDKLGKEYILKFLDTNQQKVFIEFYDFLDRNKDKINNSTLDSFSEFIKIN
jgi:hypothetical protein